MKTTDSIPIMHIMCKTIILPTIVAFCSIGFAAQTASAAVIVDWGGDMVTANRDLSLPTPVTNGEIRTWPWSSGSAPLSPNHADYTGQEFFGALQLDTNTGEAANLTRNRIFNDAAGDYLQIWGTGENSTTSGLVFFKPAVPEGSTVRFDSTSSIVAQYSLLQYSNRRIRIAVLNDGVWYLSQASFTNTSGTLTISDASAAMWGVWSGVDGAAPLPEIPTSFTTPGSMFENIQGIGIYFTVTGNGSNSGGRFELTNFSATAVVVPEPAVALLLLLGIVPLVVLQRSKGQGPRCVH